MPLQAECRTFEQCRSITGTRPIYCYLRLCVNRCGIGPVGLDALLSDACTQHAEYLRLHSWADRTNPHVQIAGSKGSSGEGAAAAMRSAIVPLSPEKAIREFWSTYYHRLQVQSPEMVIIGLNATPKTLCVLDYRGLRGSGSHWSAPVAIDPVTVHIHQADRCARNPESRSHRRDEKKCLCPYMD